MTVPSEKTAFTSIRREGTLTIIPRIAALSPSQSGVT